MIDSRHIRVGNLLAVPDLHLEYGTVEDILSRSGIITFKESVSYSHRDTVEPIKITDEWLKKFGFTQKTGICENHWEIPNTSPYFQDGMLCRSVGWDEEDVFEVGCDYVHELQNAWFIFEDQELEIKL